MKSVLSISLGLLVSVGATAQPKEALRELFSENYAQARSLFLKNAQIATDASGAVYAAQYHLYMGHPDSSATFLTKAAAMTNAKDPFVAIAAGIVALGRNDAALAEKSFATAMKVGKKNAEVFRTISQAYIIGKQAKKAIEIGTMATDKDAKNPFNHITLGDAYVAALDGGKALNSYQLATYHDKTFTPAYMKTARIYRSIKNPSEVVAAYENALKIDPKFVPALRELSEFYYEKRDYKKTKEAYANYMKVAGSTTDMKVRYMNILYNAGDFKEVITEAESLVKAEPSKIDLYRSIGLCACELKDSVKAASALETYLQKAPADKITSVEYECLGKSQMKLGRSADAISNFEKAIVMDSTNIALLKDVAESYVASKNYEKAAKYYAQRGKFNPKPAQDISNAAYYYEFLKDYAGAEAQYIRLMAARPDLLAGSIGAAQSAVRLDPESAAGRAKPFYEKVVETGEKDSAKNATELKEAYSYLAAFHCKAKNKASADEFARKLQTLDPSNGQAQAVLSNSCM